MTNPSIPAIHADGESVGPASIESTAPLLSEPNKPISGEPATEVTGEPATEVSAEPVTEVTGEPATEVSAEPVTEVSGERAAEVTGEPATEVTADLSAEPVESFSEILRQYDRTHSRRAEDGGKTLQGTVIAVTADSVFVDIGFKTEGVLPLSAFQAELASIGQKEGSKAVKAGIRSR